MMQRNPQLPRVHPLLRTAVFLLMIVATTTSASGQDELARLEAMWKRGEYASTLNALVEFRQRTKIKTCQIDYMIATCACRSQLQAEGKKFFAWILDNYSLSIQNRRIIEDERDRCSTKQAPTILRATTPATLVGIVYSGKGGTQYRASSSGNGTAELVDAIPLHVLASRLFQPSQSQAALASVRSLLGPAAQIELVGNMILAAPGRTEDTPSPRSSGPVEIPNRSAAPNRPAYPNEPAPPNREATSNQSATPRQSPTTTTGSKTGVQQTGVNPSGVRTQGVNTSGAEPSGRNPAGVNAPNVPGPLNKVSQIDVRQSREPEQTVQQQTYGSTDRLDLVRVGNDLQRYAEFFIGEFQMQPPSHLITVYFTPDVKELRSLARKIHGIELAPGSIGYSFPGDQSMVGWADGRAYGTFAHELFHLMIRGNFGDAPPWLDEGMAALYEVSGFEADRAVGKDNWRGEILRKLWATRPSLRQLVQMDRSQFDDIDESSRLEIDREKLAAGERQAVNHAAARYFMLYLQERRKLRSVYLSFLKREVSDQAGIQSIALLESVLGRPLDQVDADFADWFKSIRN